MSFVCLPYSEGPKNARYFRVIEDSGRAALAEVSQDGTPIDGGLIAYIDPNALKLVPFYSGSLPTITEMKTVNVEYDD